MQSIELNKPLEDHNWKGEKMSKWFSLPVIILFMIIFCPIGVYLAYRRINGGEYTTKHPGRGLLITGIVFGGIGILDLSSSFEEGATQTPISSFFYFFVPGIILFAMGFWISKKAKKYSQYSSWINGGMTSLDSLSAAMGVSYEQTKKDLKKLIDKGYIGKAYVDEKRGELIFAENMSQYDYSFENEIEIQVETEAEPVVKKCPNCGAANTIRKGIRAECEYCGSLLK